MENPPSILWNTFATCNAKKRERSRTLPNAPLFSQLNPLPVSANLVFINTFDLREGGLGVGWLVEISVLDTLHLCVISHKKKLHGCNQGISEGIMGVVKCLEKASGSSMI
jgi:hypothetical protein